MPTARSAISPRDEEHLTGLELQGNARIETPNAQARRPPIDVGRRHSPDVLRKHRLAAERDRHGLGVADDCGREGHCRKRAPCRQYRDRHGAGRYDAHVAECPGPRRVRSVGGERAAGEESDVDVAGGERSRRQRADRGVVHRRRGVSGDGWNAAGQADGHLTDARYVAQRRPRPDSGSDLHRIGAVPG